MPNFMFFGYTYETETAKGDLILKPSKTFETLSKSIDIAMKDIKLQDEAVKTWIPSLVTTCDGKNTDAPPYIRIFSSEVELIPLILAAFQKHGLEEDIEIRELLFFVEGKDIKSGDWRPKWKIKFRRMFPDLC